ncbi:DUF2683 family protein [Parapedobacter indicus]|uniref:Uncharacterized protein n=1 Tax=Parapedobacter indicus TaxID=1477437 RepID=A0A1I3SP49_9SPHI|nr:DUF2683 family protein [Parapedobacter indicus]PPK99765.1 hypothetical protein CLV26_11198 [Parapedobacter indicus]SFJ59569.1 hypothetical protein SAMN05444682_111101 [Parapedobacter indicus]
MGYLIVHPDTSEKLTAIKVVLKALKVDFEESKAAYNTDFVAKMQEGEEDIKAGRTVKMTLDELWK